MKLLYIKNTCSCCINGIYKNYERKIHKKQKGFIIKWGLGNS